MIVKGQNVRRVMTENERKWHKDEEKGAIGISHPNPADAFVYVF